MRLSRALLIAMLIGIAPVEAFAENLTRAEQMVGLVTVRCEYVSRQWNGNIENGTTYFALGTPNRVYKYFRAKGFRDECGESTDCEVSRELVRQSRSGGSDGELTINRITGEYEEALKASGRVIFSISGTCSPADNPLAAAPKF